MIYSGLKSVSDLDKKTRRGRKKRGEDVAPGQLKLAGMDLDGIVRKVDVRNQIGIACPALDNTCYGGDSDCISGCGLVLGGWPVS